MHFPLPPLHAAAMNAVQAYQHHLSSIFEAFCKIARQSTDFNRGEEAMMWKMYKNRFRMDNAGLNIVQQILGQIL
jgi:hypothetical protein